MTILSTLAALTMAGAVSGPAVADDDRAPTAQERSAIESVLRAEGFVRWDEIELDDGVWEVDDARTAQGREYDLKLRPGTYEIIRREADANS